nr:RNA-directed DNA polymerase, eukaryota, reverse transcriptase zinc-binding domain protein [Tanacetum cinerariifolium]
NSERISRRYIPREREVAEEKLRREYFGDENTPPIYREEYFRRRYTTKEEDVAKISTSLFITNFPESTSAKEMFNACKQYGHVVDTFIPTKRSKAGKRVKEFASLAYLKMALYNEGFMDIKIQYKGEFWVLMEFVNEKSLKLFRDNVFRIRAKETPGWVPEFMDDEDDDDDEIKNGGINGQETGNGVNSDAEEVPETAVEEKGQEENNADEENLEKTGDKSKDPETSGINKEDGTINNYEKVNEVNVEEFQNLSGNGCSKYSKEVESDSICSGHFKKSKGPKTGGSILNLLDEVIKVGHVMGYKMDGCWVPEFMDDEDDDDQTDDQYDDEIKNDGINGQETGNGVNSDAEEVPETAVDEEGHEENNADEESLEKTGDKSEDPFNIYQLLNKNNDNGLAQKAKKDWVKQICVRNKINFLALQETKMENMDIVCVKNCWGNLGFEYVHSDSVGNSGEILYVWDPNSFCKSSVTISDSFVMMRGVWRQSGKDVLLIAVYAPHDFKEKLLFAGLVEVSLGGCSFTWCHKSATKMSKLDRFLVSGTLFNSCPNISALSLERFFHYWSELEGFGNVVKAAWKEYPNVEQNAMINMMGKLKHLKKKIREWNIKDKQRRSMDKDKYKVDLEALDTIIDQGNGNEEIVKQRSEIVSKLLHIDKLSSVEMAQKAKVKWSIEGDENTSFFHGVINKKRNLLDIRGIMVDGSWVDEPSMVKRDFFNHFRNRFEKPDGIRAITHMEYPRRISLDKQSELEGEIPNANLVKDFRPISLIGSLYKIISKILASRLAGVLGDIVNEVQSAFVADKQILDGPFILNEVIQCYGEPSIIVSAGRGGENVQRASGLKINMSKSKILGVHVESDRVKEAALRLGCLTLKTPFLYLGSKVAGSMSRLHEWDEVVERVKMRLSKWKMKSLSIGGRLTLLKSVLESMTIFNMSIFKVPLGVLHTLESIRSHFFNGHALGSNKASWVRVIKAMYGDKGRIDAEVKTGSRSCWLNIVHEAEIFTQKGITLRDFMRIKLGNGENTSFWEDCWIEGDSLRNRFPRLYNLESCKRITVGEKMRQPSLEFLFQRNTRGGVEEEQLGDLVTLMHDVSLSPMADRWTWALENSGEFTVSSVRKHIDDKLIPEVGSKTRWIKYVPIKVNVNAWKVKLDALPTRMITRWCDVSYEDFVDYDDWRTWIINLRLPSKNKMMIE